ncbi:S41 family peptidase [Candidatus Sumerlaeota bacterium]|nr:S41 family peptidase [Candidatus Sumerlaeota bacterium]
MNFWRKAPKADKTLFVWAFVCLMLSVAMLGAKEKNAIPDASEDEEFLRFVDVAAEVYNEVRGKYVDEVVPKDVLEGALQGMFSRLDEHSQYMDPSTLENLNKDTGGEFGGIGIHITTRQGLLTVIAPIPGSPSAALGVMSWDRIIEIDGQTTENMPLQEAVDKLTGPPGTKVKVKIYREGETQPLEFEITRAIIKVDSVYHKMLEDNVGYLRIARFSETTGADARKALLDMKAEGMKALIMDLRYNTGGLLRESIEISNLFVPKHEMIVSTKGRLRSQNKEYRATEDPLITGMPIFVLVNEGSASASEIVAGALQDHHLAVIVGPAGKNTFGKGSVQTIEPLRHSMYDDKDGNPKDSALRLTTARYYTPSGRTIHHIGITPDIGIPLNIDQERALLRHGLLGDTSIQMTQEEKEAEDAAKEKKALNLDQEPAEEGVQVNVHDEKPAVEEEKKDDQPFYSKVKKPQMADDSNYHDVLLDEALKQLKIYMILDGTRQGDATKLAKAAQEAPAPAAAVTPDETTN